MPIYNNALTNQPVNRLVYPSNDSLGAAFVNPNIQRQGARARALAQQRDVNTLPDPKTYAAISGLLGTRPDEMGFSVMNPDYEAIMQTARPAFYTGTALGVAPMVGLAGKALGTNAMAVGRAGERYAERVVPQIMERGGMPAEMLQGMAQGTRRQIFVGENSKTWNKANAAKAIEMEKAGVNAREIWKETGTWKAPDGKWRQEIPDNKAQLLNLERGKLGNAFDHEAAYLAYPDAKNIGYMPAINGMSETPFASFTPSMKGAGHGQISVNAPGVKSAESSTLHELQHAIQQREGWARGGMPNQFASVELDKKMLTDGNILTRMRTAEEYGSLDSAIETFKTRFKRDPAPGAQSLALSGEAPDAMLKRRDALLSPFESYQRLAGEAEARATQARIPLDAAQRRATFPADSYDVPLDKLIIRGGDSEGLLQASAQAKPFVYPQAKALATAQLNAAKSIDDGGLGLLANNTPAQRARAMGFDADAWHGTSKTNIKSLNRSTMGAQGPGVYLGDHPMVANAYSGDGKGANVIPALLSGKYAGNMEFSKEVGTHGWKGAEDALKASGSSGIHDTMFESAYNVFDPKSIRSRFAAFDPARRNEADILGRAHPELLKWMAGAGLLGTAGYSALQDR